MRYPERVLNQLTNPAQQILKVKHGGSLLGDGVDRLQLPGALLLERVEPRVLQSYRCLGGEKREQIDGLGVEMVHAVALAIEHAHDFIPNHQGDGELRMRGLGRAEIARILCDVGRINGLFLESGGSGYTLARSPPNLVLPFVPADLRANVQLLRLLVEQQYRDIPQVKVVPCDGQDALQHLVQIEGGEHGLAGIVQDRDVVHSSGIDVRNIE